MKKLYLVLISVLFVFGAFAYIFWQDNPLKTYRVAIIHADNKADTVNYYFYDENYDLSGGFGVMLSMRNGCLCKQHNAEGHTEIVCGIINYKLISISKTPKSVEYYLKKQNAIIY